METPRHSERIGGTLVIQPLPGIGDMVWHLPHIDAIAGISPGGTVTVLTKARSRADQLFAADPRVRDVLWLERESGGRHAGLGGFLRLVRLLRSRRFEAVWILHDSTRYVLATWLAGIPRRIGAAVGSAGWLLTDAVMLTAEQRRMHPIDKADLLVQAQHLTLPKTQLMVATAATQRIAERYTGTATPWVALGIGSSELYKQWGAQRFGELACALAARYGFTPFLIGGDGERGLGSEIIAAAQRQGAIVQDALGLSVADTMALLASCRAYVGNDTGFLNVAAALDIPAFGLFGASPPLSHSNAIHCLLPEDGSVPAYGTPYMDRISVPGVMAALISVLGTGEGKVR